MDGTSFWLEWTDSAVEKRSSDSKATERGGCVGVSEGRMKSPGRTEEVSAPPRTLPSCSIADLCQSRGLLDFFVESAKENSQILERA
jgi:hypothetical protein